jgi:transcriptional regulator with XRE-family HTH domain
MSLVALRPRFAPMAAMRQQPPPATATDEAKALGLALRSLRMKRNITQEAASEAMGVTRTAWQNYENGRAVILRMDLQASLAAALGATREDLMLERNRIAIGAVRATRSPSGFAEEGPPPPVFGADLRTASFPLPEGEVTITFPASLSPDSFMQLEGYLEVFLRANRPPAN